MRFTLLSYTRRALPTINRRAVGSATVVAILSTAVVIAAVRADGAKATNIHLDDGAVWVTNQRTGRVGRLNVRVDELDLAVVAGSNADVVQEARNVFLTGANGGVKRIDVVSGQLSSGDNSIDLADYKVNGGVGVLFDAATGKLWVGRSAALVGSAYPKKADAQIEPGSKVAVTAASEQRLDASGRPRGKVLVADSRGWYEIALDGNYHPVRRPHVAASDATADSVVAPTTTVQPLGTLPEPEPDPIEDPVVSPLAFAIDETTTTTAVGDRFVFLKTDGTLFSTSGKAAKIPGGAPTLQPPGPQDGSVLVASTAGLFEVAIGSDTVTQLSKATGTPTAPIRVGPCVYGAWSGETPTWFKQCGAKIVVDGQAIPNAAPNAKLVYRVNQSNVALNSVGDGDVWADHDGKLAHVGNWADAEPDNQNNPDQSSSGPATRVAEKKCIEHGDQSPTTGDDQLGVRPHQTIIDLLYNDDDANCEPIAIVSVDPTGGDWGQLTIIDNGQHLLFSPSQRIENDARNSVQTVSFTYTIADSTGHTSSPPATVTMSVKDRKLGNDPPRLRPKTDGTARAMRAVVEEGRTISYSVLADWWDPDGDDLHLEKAVPQGHGEVSSTPDGVVRYSANGVSASVQKVDVTMSDGLASATDPLEVTVKPSGSPIPPITSNDFVTLVEGASATVYPLANDSDPNEDALTLVPTWPIDAPGYHANPRSDGAVEVTGIAQGTYALPYDARDDTDKTTGFIRLVVLKDDGTNHSPVAVPDEINLRPARVVNVDVLANDIDADGDLLAITDVDRPTAANGVDVRASIIDRRMIQVEVVATDGPPPTGTFSVTYHIDDGRSADRAAAQDAAASAADSLRATGVITVSIVASLIDQPPVASNDSAVVRTGDIVAVPVLANDSDPDGDALVLEGVDPQQTSALEASGDGVAWVSGRSLYFQGGTPGGQKTLQYSVLANGKEASAVVTFHVTPAPVPVSNPNSSPTPTSLVLRAVRDAKVRLAIPLFGVDPDGDSVTIVDAFTGLQGAAQGNKVELDPANPGAVLFTAGHASGPVDSFNYTVQDSFGATGTATVKVVVLENRSWPPAAHDDIFRAKPGRTLTIPVLANDTSPQDNSLQLDELPFFVGRVASASPQHPDAVTVLDQEKLQNHGRIEVKVPIDGNPLNEHYRITDGKSPSDAFLRVTPDPNAPNLGPVATPHVVTASQVTGKEAITVNVLADDFDPDDDRPLTVSIPAGQNATAAQGVVTVALQRSPQLVLYRLTDADKASTIGVIRVPGKENHPPVLTALGKDPTARTIQAGDATPLTILLSDIVEDPDKDPRILLTATEVKVLGGQGSVTRLDGNDGFAFVPPSNLTSPVQATIQFEVTDHPDAPEPKQHQLDCHCLAVLSIVVNIQAKSPPRVLSQGNVPVPQYEEPVSYDLAPLTTDDQGDSLKYRILDSNPGGLQAQLSGSTLTLVSHRSDADTIPVGTTILLKYTVTDGSSDAVENTVKITVIATNRGRPVAAVFADQAAERSVSLTLPNLIAPATNPFPEHVLTLLNEAADSGSVTCTPTGDCQFRSDNVGTFHVSYTLKDAIGQTAAGALTVVVKGKPLAPGVPSIDSRGDHLVNLTWTPADMQGGVFKTYHVTAVEAGRTMEFTSTGGQFTGLTNGTTYHFTVLAENELGMGDVSAQSSAGIPDRVPDPPVGPSFPDYGDGVLYLQWSAPPTAGDFTAITKYEIAIGGQTLSTDGGITTTSANALQNGTDYSFKVRAQNDAGWGEWSVLSAPEHPSRNPDPPGMPVAINAGDGGTPRLTVTWSAPPFDGGRPISQYTVCRVQDAANCQTITSGLQATFTLARNLQSSFTVIAYNSDKHNNVSVASAASAITTPVGDPDVPVISGVQSIDHGLVVNATSTNGSGCAALTLQYALNGGSWQTSNTFAGLTNGTQYTATARAVLQPGCGTPGINYQSPPSAGFNQTPYGPLQTPSISAVLSGNVITWNWNANRADDGRPGWGVVVSGECGGNTNPVGSYARDFGYSSGYRTCTITVSANGVSPVSATAGQQTPPPPPSPAVTISTGGTGANGNGTTPCVGCFWINVHLRNFPPNTSYVVSSDILATVTKTVMTNGVGSADVGDGYWFCGNPVTATASAGGVTSSVYNCQ